VIRFSFTDFHELTSDLSGAERARVFFELPAALQDEAWRELDARIEARSRRLWEEAEC
jgi:hypothetical protein